MFSRIESYKRFISGDSLARLAEALGVEVWQLFEFENKQRKENLKARHKLNILLDKFSPTQIELIYEIAFRILRELKKKV